MIKLVKPSDPILTKIAKAIPLAEINSPKNQEIINIMLDFAYGQQKDRKRPVLVGLAAPQIGISKRIIMVDVGADGKGKTAAIKIYINPEIIWKSQDSGKWYEGCYSTNRVCGIVSRPSSVNIRAYNETGLPVEEFHQGYTARIFQHEIDHLNGIEFVSHIKNLDDLHWVEEEEFPLYRDHEGWRHWYKKCSWAKWKKIKGISFVFGYLLFVRLVSFLFPRL